MLSEEASVLDEERILEGDCIVCCQGVFSEILVFDDVLFVFEGESEFVVGVKTAGPGEFDAIDEVGVEDFEDEGGGESLAVFDKEHNGILGAFWGGSEEGVNGVDGGGDKIVIVLKDFIDGEVALNLVDWGVFFLTQIDQMVIGVILSDDRFYGVVVIITSLLLIKIPHHHTHKLLYFNSF